MCFVNDIKFAITYNISDFKVGELIRIYNPEKKDEFDYCLVLSINCKFYSEGSALIEEFTVLHNSLIKVHTFQIVNLGFVERIVYV